MIVAHNNDYEVFNNLLNATLSELELDSKQRSDYYLSRGGTNLEKDVYRIINSKASNTVYQDNIELISGQKFPDIVAYANQNQAYGLEVKTTTQNKWKSTGSSIFEGTRVNNIENIHLLFGKLTNPIEFKCRKYEECLYDVAVTHSPRYLIDMDTLENSSIFAKVGMNYNDLRQLPNPFSPIKKYFRKNLKAGEDLWWIDEKNENPTSLTVKLWSKLTPAEKQYYKALAFAYFPHLISKDPYKYGQLATLLISRFGIVNPSLRDTFSAGGKIEMDGLQFPKVYEHVIKNLDQIFAHIMKIDQDDIRYYWGLDKVKNDILAQWKSEFLKHAKSQLNNEQINILKQRLK